MTKVLAWVVGVAVFWLVLDLLGVDVWGWINDLWDQISDIPKGYLVAALFFQTLQTFFAGLSYYGILKFAYKDEVTLWPIIAAYAVGVAMNGFLPANLGTFVTLLMFVAIIPSCTVGGAIAAYLVQKIFFTLAGTFVYLYMFLERPELVRRELRREPQGVPVAHGPHRRGRRRADRDPRPDPLVEGQEALGAGQAGRRHPRRAEDVSQAAHSCRRFCPGVARSS